MKRNQKIPFWTIQNVGQSLCQWFLEEGKKKKVMQTQLVLIITSQTQGYVQQGQSQKLN